MKHTMDMAREAGMKFSPAQFSGVLEAEIDEFSLEILVGLVRADEREVQSEVCKALYAEHKGEENTEVRYGIAAVAQELETIGDAMLEARDV